MQCFLHQGEALKAFNALCVGDGFSIEAQARVQATTKKPTHGIPIFFLPPVSYWIFFLMKHEFSPDETIELSHIFSKQKNGWGKNTSGGIPFWVAALFSEAKDVS